MFDEQHLTHDTARVSFDDDAPGITVDEEDGVEFEWDDVETTTVDDPPHAEAFDSKEFYKIPATVAKPIPQPYQYGEDTVWLKKPREELKKAAWSLDNAPWTLGHPGTGMVKNVDDVHGFWGNPRYIDSLDDLDADLHVPVGDEDAKEYLEANADVSVGFYNRIARTDDYDGIIGGEDADGVEIEGYQTDMLFDHIASVGVGRCPSGAGCGIDSAQHGHVGVVDEDSFKRGTRIMDTSDEADGADSMDETEDAGRTIDGTWFAVPPEDTSGDDPKFPIDSCSDVQDAWQLRGHAKGLSIDQSTLENRIQNRAESLDCDVPDAEESEDSLDALEAALDRYDIDGCGCGCGGDCDDEDTDTTMEIDFDDLSTEAALAKVSAQHDGAEERLDELREAEDAAETAQEAADELDLDDVSELADAVSMLRDTKEDLEETVSELERPSIEEDAEYIAGATDRFGDDAEEVIESIEEDLDDGDSLKDAVESKRELVEDLTEGYDEQTANSGGEGGDGGESTGRTGKYAKTPWE